MAVLPGVATSDKQAAAPRAPSMHHLDWTPSRQKKTLLHPRPLGSFAPITSQSEVGVMPRAMTKFSNAGLPWDTSKCACWMPLGHVPWGREWDAWYSTAWGAMKNGHKGEGGRED